MIQGIHHMSLRVSDFDRSLTLYRDVFGLAEKVRFELEGKRFVLLETGNSGYLELVEAIAGGGPVDAPGEKDVHWHFALRVDDLDAAMAKVEEAGLKVTVPVTALELTNSAGGESKPWPIRIAFFNGPDGECVEFLEDKSGQS